LTQPTRNRTPTCREQQEQCAADRARHVIEHGLDEYAGTPIGPGIVTRQISRQHGHVSASLLERHASLQACDREVAIVASLPELIGRNVQRRPELEVAVGILEVGAHHSDDLIW
jgi:hypothetical protein